MFQSKRRHVIYPQAEHARFSGAIAAAWRPDDVPLPFDSFVRGVALHDRGYGELDIDAIGVVSDERWTEIQTRGFRMKSGDDVTDLVVALHIRRLIGDEADHPLAREIDEALGEVPPEARAADRITELCDRISFAVCFEEAEQGPGFDYDGDRTVVLDPWPLAVPELTCILAGYSMHAYPVRLDPVIEVVRLRAV
jgi:hypothetical protein